MQAGGAQQGDVIVGHACGFQLAQHSRHQHVIRASARGICKHDTHARLRCG